MPAPAIETKITIAECMYLIFRYSLNAASGLSGGGFGRLLVALAAVFEEVAEHSGGFGFEEAAFHGEGVVESVVGGGVVEGAGVAGLRVGGGVDEASEPGGVGGAGARGVGFEGGVAGTAGRAAAA